MLWFGILDLLPEQSSPHLALLHMTGIIQAISLIIALSAFASAAKPPNILLILTDDLGYGDVRCYNDQAKVPTPRMDRLAGEGMRFTDAHSPATVCTPTRYSVMTGRMAFRTGRHIVFQGAGGPNLIEEGRLTLPGMLRQQGYRTAMFGKWHIGLTFLDADGKPIHNNNPDGVGRIDYSRAIPDAPIHRGFDRFFGTACCPTTDWLYAFIDGDRIPVPPTGMIDRSKYSRNPYTEDFRDGAVAPDFDVENIDLIFLRRSIEFLENHAKSSPDKPFFLFHSTQAVHLPSIPAKTWQGKSKAGPHGDFIAQLDDNIGSLLDKIEELNLANDTLVILTSDNGPEVTTTVNMRKAHEHDGARPWRGVKRDQWEGGHRVPLIVRWPEKIKPGSVTDQTASLTDIMATAAAITGFSLPDHAAEDSFDILPVLLGKDSGKPVRPYTLQQTWSAHYSIRVGQWKYIDHKGSGGNDYHKWPGLDAYILSDTAPEAPGQLYDLTSDPGETTNLYFKHSERVKEMKALLDQSIAAGRSAPSRSK
jgi:arylsulfatase A